ncbi:YbaK/EbsC family protein [Pseudogracilibacillus sp. SE30717A]|uniref:YbaK/EbsC family protein n=1 Tax=Pseudogracilibacillus sp. SE30717A TaxID=3098293 RepID=UPI00300DC2B5
MSVGGKESVQRFEEILRAKGLNNKIVELPNNARTAKEAADAIGCEVSHIAKSIIFRLENTKRPLLIVASGRNRIDEKKIETYIDDTLGKADAEFVREHTGYVIGGVPPLGHTEKIETLIDEDLFEFKTIWAAAGHPKTVFELTPDELVKMTEGQVVSVK